jgi:hypothetical protein
MRRDSPCRGAPHQRCCPEVEAEPESTEVTHQPFKSGTRAIAAENVAYVADRAVLIVLLAFVGVSKDAVRLVNLLEPLSGFLFLPDSGPGDTSSRGAGTPSDVGVAGGTVHSSVW